MFTATVLHDLCEMYNIGRLIGNDQFYAEHADTHYTLVTTEGRFTVRRIDAERSLRSVLCEHQLIAYLRAHAFPALTFAATRYGTTVALVNEQFYVLPTELKGEVCDPRQPTQLRVAATALATFHSLALHYPGHPPACSDYSLEQLFDQGMLALEALEGRISGSPFLRRNRAIQQRLIELNEMLDELHDSLRSVDEGNLPRTLIHGSFGPDVLLFEGQQLTSVLGYEHARKAPRLLDVAYALAHFGVALEQPCESVLGVLLRTFVDTYTAQNPLAIEELALLPLVLRCCWVNAGLRRSSDAIYGDADDIARRLHTMLASLDWLDTPALGPRPTNTALARAMAA